MSEGNLAALNRLSPGNSRSSLERFLNSQEETKAVLDAIPHLIPPPAQPLKPKPIPSLSDARFDPSAMPGPIDYSSGWDERRILDISSPWDVPFDLQSRGSVSSAASSASSQRSFDPRGSRRGRVTWTGPAPPTVLPKERFPCTYFGCLASFNSRYQWARHEEAVHFVPYRWVCCPDLGVAVDLPACFICKDSEEPPHSATKHFESCALKDEKDRTFYRQDQFKQHIAGKHCREYNCQVPESFLRACQSDNPSFDLSALRCKFCGHVSSSWTERQDHVVAHFNVKSKKGRKTNVTELDNVLAELHCCMICSSVPGTSCRKCNPQPKSPRRSIACNSCRRLKVCFS